MALDDDAIIIVSSRSFTVVKNWSKVSATWQDAYDHSHS